jgi:hypothetical protein
MTTRATSAAWTTTSRMVNRLVGCVPHAGFFSIRYGFRFCMSLIGTPVVVHVHGGGGDNWDCGETTYSLSFSRSFLSSRLPKADVSWGPTIRGTTPCRV